MTGSGSVAGSCAASGGNHSHESHSKFLSKLKLFSHKQWAVARYGYDSLGHPVGCHLCIGDPITNTGSKLIEQSFRYAEDIRFAIKVAEAEDSADNEASIDPYLKVSKKEKVVIEKKKGIALKWL